MSTTGSVVVGVDGSPASDAACRYAAQQAAALRVPVVLVHAWREFPMLPAGLWQPMYFPPDLESARAAAAQILAKAAVLAESTAPGVVHEEHLSSMPADIALIEAGKDARLLVVGGRERGRHVSGWLGPVPLRIVERASCPVVAVPTEPSLTGAVVVGVDGHAASTEAVAFAFEEASRTGAELMAVHAFPLAFGGVVVESRQLEELHEGARRELSEALAGWREKFPDVRVCELVSAEHPVRALRIASETASLLVLGTHGRGVFGRFVLGSVVAALLRVADCPVAVVRPPAHPS